MSGGTCRNVPDTCRTSTSPNLLHLPEGYSPAGRLQVGQGNQQVGPAGGESGRFEFREVRIDPDASDPDARAAADILERLLVHLPEGVIDSRQVRALVAGDPGQGGVVVFADLRGRFVRLIQDAAIVVRPAGALSDERQTWRDGSLVARRILRGDRP